MEQDGKGPKVGKTRGVSKPGFPSPVTSIGKAAGWTEVIVLRSERRRFGAKPERSAQEFRRTGPQGRKHFGVGRCLSLGRERRESR
jgi:hypothetical protein